MSEQVTNETLKDFLEAFNRPRGDRYVGKAEIRAGLASRFEGIPDVHYGEDKHWICGDLGVSEWTLTGTTKTGLQIEVRGLICSSSQEERSSAKILSGRYWIEGRLDGKGDGTRYINPLRCSRKRSD